MDDLFFFLSFFLSSFFFLFQFSLFFSFLFLCLARATYFILKNLWHANHDMNSCDAERPSFFSLSFLYCYRSLVLYEFHILLALRHRFDEMIFENIIFTHIQKKHVNKPYFQTHNNCLSISPTTFHH